MGTTDPAIAAFSAIANDEQKLRAFVASIGDANAPSRLRATRLLATARNILDVGCGTAATFYSFAKARARDPSAEPFTGNGLLPPLRYLGVEPVERLATLSTLPIRRPPKEDVGHWVKYFAAVNGKDGSAAIVNMPAVTFLACCPWDIFDGVVIRHVLEHHQDPFPILHAASVVVPPRGRLFVALSQATHGKGPNARESLKTDEHLGASRWSHGEGKLHDSLCLHQGRRWQLVDHATEADGLVVREESFCWERAE